MPVKNPFVIGLLLLTIGILVGYAVATHEADRTGEGLCPCCGRPLSDEACVHVRCIRTADPSVPEVHVPPMDARGMVIDTRAGEEDGGYRPEETSLAP